jgi:hypothetical protein
MAKNQIRTGLKYDSNDIGKSKFNPAERREVRRLQDSASAAQNTAARMGQAKANASKTQVVTKPKPQTMAAKKTAKTGSRFA